jgi:hypothetical protein
MDSLTARIPPPIDDSADAWQPFPGGELEGRPSSVRCKACRQVSQTPGAAPARPGTLCFQCYRADLDRQKALQQAAALDTGSEERFQWQLPLDPVDRPRVAMLRAARVTSRASMAPRQRDLVERRRRAQIAARDTLGRLAAGLKARGIVAGGGAGKVVTTTLKAEAPRRAVPAEFPEAWLPFLAAAGSEAHVR